MQGLHFEIEKDGMNYHTWCPELPGCHSHGKTVIEAMDNLKDAVQIYLDVVIEEEITIKAMNLEHEAP